MNFILITNIFINIVRYDVFPSEVEEVLHMHPNVKEAVVFGIRINDYQHEICAWIIVFREVINTSSEELQDFCSKYLIDYKIPKYIKFVDKFPSSKTGKYLKNEMEKQYKEELGL